MFEISFLNDKLYCKYGKYKDTKISDVPKEYKQELMQKWWYCLDTRLQEQIHDPNIILGGKYALMSWEKVKDQDPEYFSKLLNVPEIKSLIPAQFC